MRSNTNSPAVAAQYKSEECCCDEYTDNITGSIKCLAQHVDEIIENLVSGLFENPYMIVGFIMFIIFWIGFLLNWIEITLIIMPLMLPVILSLELAVNGFGVVSDPSVVWLAILVAITLQTSFLTPPVGFALFYPKGFCPPDMTFAHIYRGVMPFVALKLTGLAIVFSFPALTTWLPAMAYGN